MRINEHFGLNKSQYELDFININTSIEAKSNG